MEDSDVLHVDTRVASWKCAFTREKGVMATLRGAVGWDSLRASRGQPRVSGSPAPWAPSAAFPAACSSHWRVQAALSDFFKAFFLSLKGQILCLPRSGVCPLRGLGKEPRVSWKGTWACWHLDGGKWLSPTTSPSGPTEARLQSGLRRAHTAWPWLLLGFLVRAPPQGQLGSQALLAPSPQTGSWPGSGV